jgi:hypothetical protein
MTFLNFVALKPDRKTAGEQAHPWRDDAQPDLLLLVTINRISKHNRLNFTGGKQ